MTARSFLFPEEISHFLSCSSSISINLSDPISVYSQLLPVLHCCRMKCLYRYKIMKWYVKVQGLQKPYADKKHILTSHANASQISITGSDYLCLSNVKSNSEILAIPQQRDRSYAWKSEISSHHIPLYIWISQLYFKITQVMKGCLLRCKTFTRTWSKFLKWITKYYSEISNDSMHYGKVAKWGKKYVTLTIFFSMVVDAKGTKF